MKILTFMLGCYIDNETTNRTIEACGGYMAETKLYKDGKMMESRKQTICGKFPQRI
ncbi:hypothetical protein [Clostridium sp. chh4-2]|uniref:hypothetical protein n=1 Tax=Clostridium sp. chh4-2 TaxID=2067550 RepID=UPI0015E188B2|nr:hypothetical protein [Clostridium sp. chh4-2]